MEDIRPNVELACITRINPHSMTSERYTAITRVIVLDIARTSFLCVSLFDYTL